jgi:glycosyltransferase involved in cell wall biosynthesis
MKMLCISPGYYPAFELGGIVASVHGLNKALVDLGVDVTVWGTTKCLEDKVIPNVPVVVGGVKITYFSYLKQFEFIANNGWQFSPALWNSARKHIAEFDIVHIHSVWNFPVSLVAHYCRKNNLPYVIAPRGMLYPYTAGKYGLRKMPYYWLCTRKDIHRAALMHYTSSDEAEKCQKRWRLKNSYMIIPNGIDTKEYSNIPSRQVLRDRYKELGGKVVFLYLGRINWKKGIDLLIRAFAKAYSVNKNIHLLIVGGSDPGYLETLKALLVDRCLHFVDHLNGDRFGENGFCVTFSGMLTGADKISAYAGSDVFVLCSHSENFGNTVIEAQACGLPVIVSDQTGAAELVDEWKSGVLVQTNVSSLSAAITKLNDEKSLREEMGRIGKVKVKSLLSWEGIAKKVLDQYNGILKLK